MFGGSISIGRIRGIRIGIDYSWFLVLFLVIFWLSGFYRDLLGVGSDSVEPYVLALASAVLFFGSILLHELGHAVVAMRNGIGITGINLWMFGGVAKMDRDTDSAGAEFRIAAAGPLVTALIVFACAAGGLAVVGSEEFWAAMRVDSDAGTSGALAVLAWLTTINAAVLLFNLIPAFPLDGGRIARAIAWRLSGDRGGATRFAARMGQAFAMVFVGLGIFLFVTTDAVGGIWLAVIGFILGQAAKASAVQTNVLDRIQGLSVGDVMDREPVAVPAEERLDRAFEDYFLRYGWKWFPVVDAAGRFTGVLWRAAVDGVPEEVRSTMTVAAATEEGGGWSVDELDPLEGVLGNESLRRLGAAIATDAEGRLRGVLTAGQIGRALKGGPEDAKQGAA